MINTSSEDIKMDEASIQRTKNTKDPYSVFNSNEQVTCARFAP